MVPRVWYRPSMVPQFLIKMGMKRQILSDPARFTEYKGLLCDREVKGWFVLLSDLSANDNRLLCT